MGERYYRLLTGSLLLAILYLDISIGMVILLTVFLFEGITNLRIPGLLIRSRATESDPEVIPETVTLPLDNEPASGNRSSQSCAAPDPSKNTMEAERGLRFVLIVLLAPTYFLFYDTTWPIPWFVGFALVGAGMSGTCPMVNSLRRLGLS